MGVEVVGGGGISNATLIPPTWFCIKMSSGENQVSEQSIKMTTRGGDGVGGGGAYLTLHLPPKWFCIKMGSDERQFSVPLILGSNCEPVWPSGKALGW